MRLTPPGRRARLAKHAVVWGVALGAVAVSAQVAGLRHADTPRAEPEPQPAPDAERVASQYDPTPSIFRSSGVRLNKLGFAPRSPKRAIAVSDATEPLPFAVHTERGRVVLEGRSEPLGAWEQTGESTHLVDLSALTEPGRYTVSVEGLGHGDVFEVREGLYAPLAADALQFFTLWRANTDTRVDDCRVSPAGCRFTHAAGPPGDAAASHFPGTGEGTRDVRGGWFDAGDYGKYVVNGGVSAITLLTLAELYPERFLDGSGMPIVPEEGNGIPDLLDEVIWEARFFLKMQDPSGAVHHKVHDEAWLEEPMDPSAYEVERRVQAVSTEATLNAAGVWAHLARRLADPDPELAGTFEEAALRAWSWAEANPERFYTAETPDDVGGGDYPMTGDIADERYWAAAELWRTTGEARFLEAARASGTWADATRPFWADLGLFGTLALLGGDLPAPEDADLRRALRQGADDVLGAIERSNYRHPLDVHAWGSNGEAANRAVLLAVAHRHVEDPEARSRYVRGAVDSMDYLLGRNPVDYSYVTGYGPPSERAHNPSSFWFQVAGQALPGLLVGGPNAFDVADEWTPRTGAPATRYVDIERAWASNEIAINWNAPLALVATFLDEAL